MKRAVPAGLAGHAKSRTDSVTQRVKSAMADIELEIEKNLGVYPFNGGRLTQAEVCRRAGIHKITLQGKAHKATTRLTIDTWLASVNKKTLSGAKAVRKAVTERADNWKDLYLAAARQTDLYRIEAIAQNEAIDQAQKRIAELEAENLQLRSELSAGRVVPITRTRK